MSESENNEQQQGQKEPKIIVDTDWKEQVAREKEASGESQDVATSEPASADAGAESATAPTSQSGDEAFPPPPPATFEVLVSMLFTQAMAALGQMPDPASGKASVNKTYAKHFIDTMDMLSEKTEGNLNENEEKILSEALHALRMTYVNVREE